MPLSKRLIKISCLRSSNAGDLQKGLDNHFLKMVAPQTERAAILEPSLAGELFNWVNFWSIDKQENKLLLG